MRNANTITTSLGPRDNKNLRAFVISFKHIILKLRVIFMLDSGPNTLWIPRNVRNRIRKCIFKRSTMVQHNGQTKMNEITSKPFNNSSEPIWMLLFFFAHTSYRTITQPTLNNRLVIAFFTRLHIRQTSHTVGQNVFTIITLEEKQITLANLVPARKFTSSP